MKIFGKERGDAGGTAQQIIQVAALLMIGVVVLNGVVGAANIEQGEYATVDFTFNTNVFTDGHNFSIGDDVYELDVAADGVTEGNIDVNIGANLSVTLDNIVTASASGTEAVTLTEDGTDTVTVTATSTGTASNSIASLAPATNVTAGAATLTGGTADDSMYSTYTSVVNNVESGYTLAALMVLALGAAAIMRYMGFL